MKAAPLLLALAAGVLVAGCGRDGPQVKNGMLQTQLPGHVTAGGGTSGQVIARTGAATAEQPAGTPGIPEGAGGNPGGTAMGGTTDAQAQSGPGGATHPAGDGLGGERGAPSAAVSGAAGAPAAAAPAAAPGAGAGTPTPAEAQALALANSMDAVAARWRSRAGAERWPTHAPTPVADAAGIQSSATLSPPPTGQPQGELTDASRQMPIRSEKLGTAPPSEDVKKPSQPHTSSRIGDRAPDAAGPGTGR